MALTMDLIGVELEVEALTLAAARTVAGPHHA
jgi:hypothetical protein